MANRNLFDAGLEALFMSENPEAAAEILAAKGIEPPTEPLTLGSRGVQASLESLLEPTRVGGPSLPSSEPLGALAGVEAPAPPEAPRVSTPGVPRPSQAIRSGDFLQLLLRSQPAQQEPAAVPSLQSILEGRV